MVDFSQVLDIKVDMVLDIKVVVSILLLFGTFIGIVWLAAKIYRVGILMYGKKPTYKELFKWLKYD